MSCLLLLPNQNRHQDNDRTHRLYVATILALLLILRRQFDAEELVLEPFLQFR